MGVPAMSLSTRTAAILAALSVLVLAVGHAGAQPGAHPVDQRPPAPARSEATALGLSLGVTAAGLGVMAASLQYEESDFGPVFAVGSAVALIGPSAGHIYAGEPGRAVATTLIRAGGAGLVVAGASQFELCILAPCDDHDDNGPAVLLMAAGTAVIVGAAVYDFIDTPRAVRRANARALQVTPTVLASSSGLAPGLAFGGSF
ncbi:MAG TPA: hypothetical protein VM734_34765 [Kofleriaceae bacterium]|jgi:hypothetical protein|nr:hypothetical protein [Kofleriaceae bacterium]